jgi:hypothetical protein
VDAQRFDQLVRSLSEAGTRRGLLRLVASLPLAGALLALWDEEEADAHGRRKRRKKRHKHGKGKNKGNRKGKRKGKRACQPESAAQTCAGRCGTVTNNCQQSVDCGPCTCTPACPVCQLCDAASRTCGPNPATVGQSCGATGQTCQRDGTCACIPRTTCPPGANCGTSADGCGGTLACGTCPFPNQPCVNNVCGPCVPDCRGKACGADDGCGSPCLSGTCPPPETCGGGNPGTPGVCGCTPLDPCTGDACGIVTDNCGQDIDCGACPVPVIDAFAADPATADRGASPPAAATLSWSTTNAMTCSIDQGIGTVPCTGSMSVGPDTTTTYTLSASGPSGGPVTATATVTVQYCHAIGGGASCPTGATSFCLAVPIEATSSAHAQAACDACNGTGVCSQQGGCSAAWWQPPGTPTVRAYQYTDTAGANPGDIVGGNGAFVPPPCAPTGFRWAP